MSSQDLSSASSGSLVSHESNKNIEVNNITNVVVKSETRVSNNTINKTTCVTTTSTNNNSVLIDVKSESSSENTSFELHDSSPVILVNSSDNNTCIETDETNHFSQSSIDHNSSSSNHQTSSNYGSGCSNSDLVSEESDTTLDLELDDSNPTTNSPSPQPQPDLLIDLVGNRRDQHQLQLSSINSGPFSSSESPVWISVSNLEVGEPVEYDQNMDIVDNVMLEKEDGTVIEDNDDGFDEEHENGIFV